MLYLFLLTFQLISLGFGNVCVTSGSPDTSDCFPSLRQTDVPFIQPAGDQTICCVYISPPVTSPGVQPSYLTIQFTEINGTAFSSGCSISIYSVLRIQDSDLVQGNIVSLSDLSGPNNTVQVNNNQALIFINNADSCDWPVVYVAFTWSPSSETVRSTSLQMFYGLLLIFVIPICCVVITACPGSRGLFKRTNIQRSTAKLVLFLIGTFFGIIFMLLFALRLL